MPVYGSAEQDVSDEIVAQILQGFEQFDTNNDGVLDVAEVKALLTAVSPPGHVLSDDEFRTMFNALDCNTDGKVDIQEFVAWLFPKANPGATAEQTTEAAQKAKTAQDAKTAQKAKEDGFDEKAVEEENGEDEVDEEEEEKKQQELEHAGFERRPRWLPRTGKGNKNVDPPGWGMTVAQWHTFVAACRVTDTYLKLKAEKGFVTLYDLDKYFVRPWTRKTGNSISLLMNSRNPVFAQLMISHAWGEDIEETAMALTTVCAARGFPEDTVCWFCTFSQYQPGGEPEDVGPTIGEQLQKDPFKMVIESSRVRNGPGMCTVHTTRAELYGRLWCVLEIVVAAYEKVDVSAALSWLYAAQICDVFSLLGVKPSTSQARCGNPADTRPEAIAFREKDEAMIKGVVKEKFGNQGEFDHLDGFIFDFRKKIYIDMRDSFNALMATVKQYVLAARPADLAKRYSWLGGEDIELLQQNVSEVQQLCEAGKQRNAIGIDLGSEKIKAFFWKDGKAINVLDGNIRGIPTVLWFNGETCIIGDEGKRAHIRGEKENTVSHAHRLMCTKFTDSDVQDVMKSHCFKVVPGPKDSTMVEVTFNGQDKRYYPEELLSMMLLDCKMKAQTDKNSPVRGLPVTDAVIAVPSCFNKEQRDSILVAAGIADLNVLEIIDSPEATALGCGLDNKTYSPKGFTPKGQVLICDVGACMTSVAVVTGEGGTIRVKSSASMARGGMDLDNVIIDSAWPTVKEKFEALKSMAGQELCRESQQGKHVLAGLRLQCERIKQVLRIEETVEFKNLDRIDGKSVQLQLSLSRASFEEMGMDFFRSIIALMETCVRESGVRKDAIEQVVLVGGSTLTPKLHQLVQDFFDGRNIVGQQNPWGERDPGINVYEAAAKGAARCADKLMIEVSRSSDALSDARFGRDLTKTIPNTEIRETVYRHELELLQTYLKVGRTAEVGSSAAESSRLGLKEEDAHKRWLAAIGQMFTANAALQRTWLNISHAQLLVDREFPNAAGKADDNSRKARLLEVFSKFESLGEHTDAPEFLSAEEIDALRAPLTRLYGPKSDWYFAFRVIAGMMEKNPFRQKLGRERFTHYSNKFEKDWKNWMDFDLKVPRPEIDKMGWKKGLKAKQEEIEGGLREALREVGVEVADVPMSPVIDGLGVVTQQGGARSWELVA